MGPLVGVLFFNTKGRRLDSWSGHMPGLRVWSSVREPVMGNEPINGQGMYYRQRLMFLSHINISLPVSASLPHLSLKSISTSSGEDEKESIGHDHFEEGNVWFHPNIFMAQKI